MSGFGRSLAAAAAVLGLLLVAAPVARAQPPATVFLEELTWTELRDLQLAGKTTIIIPIGGTEQNGPQMALGKHNVRVKALSAKIAMALGNALVAPVIAYVPEGNVSPPTKHMRFPGTITVSDEVFAKVIEFAARSFRQNGFRDIVFLGDSGDYQKDDGQVAARLNREWAATPARAHAVEEYYRAATIDFPQELERRGYKASEIGTHAALADTSLLLAVAPPLVRADLLKSGRSFGSADGVYGGSPVRATAELGQIGIDLIVARTVEAIKKDIARR
jgi:creatinine amidohydrolase/Fe(II)-dependent formamide hydrolase-like protein